jgi:hypothetical protein
MRYESAIKLSRGYFKRSYGVYPETFEAMVKVVKVERMLQKKTGRKDKLKIEDQVLMTLAYWREYRTYFHLGQDWEINESTAYRIIRRVEELLNLVRVVCLARKKSLNGSRFSHWDNRNRCDWAWSRTPKKKQKHFYRGKDKKHTLKSQIVIDLNTKLIVCIACGKGKQHDFKIWKRSRTKGLSSIKYLGDKGYQGIQKMHRNSQIPIKKKPGQKLSKESSKINRELAKQRILIEHIHRCLKIFKVLSSRYRNRRKRLNLRLSLISGIYNYGLNCHEQHTFA